MHRRVGSIVLGTMLVASFATARHAAAACNTIPPVSQVYPSDIGSVQQRLAAPGEPVRILRTPCDRDASNVEPPLFDVVASNNVIAITLVPDAATSVPIPPFTTGTPGDCVVGGCRRLDFAMPDTDALVGTPTDGIGLAGPARVEVTRNGVTVARVETLYEPTDGCDRHNDDVFETFTVLPRPNDVQQLADGTASLRMTLDGGNNLLVPLDHRAARTKHGASGLALFERGGADFCAEPAKLTNLFCLLGPGIDDRLADAPPRSRDLLQAFTLDGHPIAPLLERDDDGWLYGTADGDFSVLRIERASRKNPSKKRFDLGHRRRDGKGPIIDNDFESAVCHAAKLAGLRATPDLVAHADKSDTLHVHRAATAGGNCGIDTQVVAAEANLGCVSEPAIEAEDALAALIRQSDQTVRVFDAKGNARTPATSKVASLDPKLNHYPLVVSGGHVYFRASDGTLVLFDPNPGSPGTAFVDTWKAQRAAIAGTRVIALDPAAPHAAWIHEYGSPAPTRLPVNGSQLATGNPLANAGDVVAIVEPPNDTVTAWHWPSGAGNAPGPAQPTGAMADDLGATRGCGPNGCASRVILITPEARQTKDLNDDQDKLDRVLQLYDAVGQTLESTKHAAAEFVSGDRLIAFRVPESAQGRDLNNDTDRADDVMHVVVFDAGAPGAFRVLTTGYAAHVDCGLQARLGWRDPYLVVDDEVLFLVSEREQGRDLNGDDVLDDIVLVIFQVPSATSNPTVTIGPTPLLPVDLSAPSAGLNLQGSGLAIGDGDGDGILDPFDRCQMRRNRRQFDDDYDRLGDRRCDPTFCTDFRPPVLRLQEADAARVRAVEGPALDYVRARATVEEACLNDIALRHRGGNATDVCRGTFVEYVENPMLVDHERIVQAERTLLAALGIPGPGHGRPAPDVLRRARLVVRAYGEAVNAATRAAYGSVVRDAGLADDQARLARATVTHLVALVDAMQRCLRTPEARRTDDIGALCLGRIEAGTIVPPADVSTAEAIEQATETLRNFLSGADAPALSRLRSCVSHESSAVDKRTCFECINWRNAARAVLSLLGAGVAPTPPAATLPLVESRATPPSALASAQR